MISTTPFNYSVNTKNFVRGLSQLWWLPDRKGGCTNLACSILLVWLEMHNVAAKLNSRYKVNDRHRAAVAGAKRRAMIGLVVVATACSMSHFGFY
jgi:hypothetical protein